MLSSKTDQTWLLLYNTGPSGQTKSYLQMGEMGALQSCFIDIKQVKSRFFSRNHRHEAPEPGAFPHLRLHWGAVAGPGQASPSAARPTSEVGAIKAHNYCSRFKGSAARPSSQMLVLGPLCPGSLHGPVVQWVWRWHKTPPSAICPHQPAETCEVLLGQIPILTKICRQPNGPWNSNGPSHV